MALTRQDAAVRKALLDLLGWVFGVVPQALIFPHMPLFLLQTSSALSHIFPEIRLDAAKLVQLLLEHVPQQVVGGWPAGAGGEASSSKVTLQGSSAAGGSTILDGLRLALGIEGTTSSANSSRLSAGAKLVLLRAVLAFLQHALGGHEEESTGKVSLPQGMFDGWTETTRKTGGKGKEKELGGPLSVFDINDEGWVAAEYGDALDLANNDAWEAGRIRGEADLDGDQETIRVAAVSPPYRVGKTWWLMLPRTCICSSIPYCCRPSSRRLPLHFRSAGRQWRHRQPCQTRPPCPSAVLPPQSLKSSPRRSWRGIPALRPILRKRQKYGHACRTSSAEWPPGSRSARRGRH